MTTAFPGRRPRQRSPSPTVHGPLRNASVRRLKAPPTSLPSPDIQQREPTKEPVAKRRRLNEDLQASLGTYTTEALLSGSHVGSSGTLEHQAGPEKGAGEARRSPRPPLYPPRPKKTTSHNGASTTARLEKCYTISKGDVSVKPYVPEAPSSAPRYHHARPADFFPWTGNHAEDVMSESTTRNGFYDKPQNSQLDPRPGTPPLWNTVKHRSGLQVLSNLFVSALGQRQAHGKVVTTTTFKPPPRVTLTDAKRESWLRDLSNPSVSLRRLSRTIPHGIRGKILLEQCLKKNIAISRAIWLAKCVGANEIRAFKRKGTSGNVTVTGEIKWIKDWTVHIEQFLESIIRSCGGPDWKTHIDYRYNVSFNHPPTWQLLTQKPGSIRLISQIYFEYLLDREHYLDWLLTSTAESDLDELATWLLYVTVNFQDLVDQRKWGKRLAELLLHHLQKAQVNSNGESCQLIVQEVVKLLQSIWLTAPACFLMPKSWNLYEHLIEDYVIRGQHALHITFEDALRRNLRLQDHLSKGHTHTPLSPEQRIIALFDSLAETPDYGSVARRSLRITDDHSIIVGTCLQWSSSRDRRGLYRVYAGARLIRFWSNHSVDVQRHILGFLNTNPNAQGLHKRELYRVIAELASSNHFSVGRYLQWLMARGTLDGSLDLGGDDRCDIRLLLELPLHDLESHVVNLRRSLLIKYGVSVTMEDDHIMGLKLMIWERLPNLLPCPESPCLTASDIICNALGQTVKSAAARWLREGLAPSESYATVSDPLSERDVKAGSTSSLHAAFIPPEGFRTAVTIFEELGEFSVLADLMGRIANIAHRATLCIMSDTINYHRAIFTAIGAAQPFFLSSYKRIYGLQDLEPSDTPLLLSLVDLGDHLRNFRDEVQHLRNLLRLITAKQSMVTFSPVSDTMLDTDRPMDVTYLDELDQMLAGGTSIDSQTTSRIFEAVIGYMPRISTDTSSLIQLAGLLSRLQSFDPKVFETLVVSWVGDLLLSQGRPPLPNILRTMICMRLLSLKLIAALTIDTMGKLKSGIDRSQIALDVLDLMTDDEVGPSVDSQNPSYRIRDQQELIIRTCPLSIIKIFQLAAGTEPYDKTKYCAVKARLESPLLLSLVHAAMLQVATKSMGAMPLDEEGQASIGGCFLRSSESGGGSLNVTQRFSNILENVNCFNILSSQLMLQAALRDSAADVEGNAIVFARIMVEALSKGPPNRTTLWARLVTVLTLDGARAVRERAANTLLSSICERTASHDREDSELRQSLLALIEATAIDSVTSWPFGLMDSISHALSASLSNHLRTDKVDVYSSNLHTLLRLLVLHQSVFQQPQIGQDTLPRILVSLGLYLAESTSSYSSATDKDILDVLNILSDYLTEDGRARCARMYYGHTKVTDCRLGFVFGRPARLESGWLQLATTSALYAEAGKDLPKDTTYPVRQPYSLRRWELVPDATPNIAENDTSPSLVFFGAMRSVL
ncbi:MAG: hypothetical protein Q9163_003166 [Psora crenata]